MDSLRLEPLAARVAAWHTRHPLALRVGPELVGSTGHVSLPYVRRGRRLIRVFGEHFIDGLSPARIGRWAARHGAELAEPVPDVPLREVAVDPGRLRDGETPLRLVVRTALVDDGWRSSRVLVGAGESPAVLGRRLWSRPRLGGAGAAIAVLVGALAVTLLRGAAPETGGVPQLALGAPAAASAASQAAPASPAPVPAASAAGASTATAASAAGPGAAPASAPVAAAPPAALPPVALAPAAPAAPAPAAPVAPVAPPVVAAAPAPAVPAPVPAATAAAPAGAPVFDAQGRPIDVAPRWGRVELPIQRPERPPAAARTAEAAPEAAAAPASSARPPVPPPGRRPAPAEPPRATARATPPPAPAAAPTGPAAAAAPATVWALATRPMRSEAEAEQVAVTMGALFQRAGLRAARVQVLELRGDSVVVGFPFPTQDAAENARHLLATRGLRTEAIEF